MDCFDVTLHKYKPSINESVQLEKSVVNLFRDWCHLIETGMSIRM
jgi:hypothetical protein